MKLTVDVYRSLTGAIKFAQHDSECSSNGFKNTMTNLGTTVLDIQEPKKRIKKYRWVLVDNTNNYYLSSEFYSEERMPHTGTSPLDLNVFAVR